MTIDPAFVATMSILGTKAAAGLVRLVFKSKEQKKKEERDEFERALKSGELKE